MIIAIAGNAGAGKDTAARMIQYYFWCKYLKSINCKQTKSCENFLRDYDKYHSRYYKEKENDAYSVAGNWHIKKFAGKLKQIASIMLGCEAEDFENEDFKNSLLPDEWQKTGQSIFGNNRTYRWFLQTLGTEAVRDNIHHNAWVNSLFADYKEKTRLRFSSVSPSEISKSSSPTENWIISDLRFLNEAKAVRDRNGYTIGIKRGESAHTHSSEMEISQIKTDYFINNTGSIGELWESVQMCMQEFKL